MSVSLSEWAGLIEREYAGTFIPDGGSAWKIVVGDAGVVQAALDQTTGLAERAGLLSVHVDGAITRLHLINEIVQVIGRSLPWEVLAQRFMERLIVAEGYVWPTPGEATPLATIAAANGVDLTLLRRQTTQALTRSVMRETRLAQDFRVAVSLTCEASVDPAHGDSARCGLAWLRGETVPLGDLRDAGIGARLNRSNARGILRSMSSWIRMCGGPGLCLTLDLRRLSRPPLTVAEGLKYTPATVLDAFEVLRQLIDDTDNLEGVLGVCVAGLEFVDEDDARRSVNAYTALKRRIWSDVQAHDRDNPLAPLVRLAEPLSDGRPS